MHASFNAPLRCSKNSKNDAGTGGGKTERIDTSSTSCTPNNQPCHPEWTASDRARRISLNDDLQRLLTKEVEEAGVVTTAGYKAVLQKFLYSDAVEEEMSHISNNAHGDRRKLKSRHPSSRFCSLISSMKSPAAPPSLAASDTSSTMSLACSQSQMMTSRRQSNGSTISSIRSRRSSNESGSRRFSNESLGSAAANSYTCNMAPRRASQSTAPTQDQQEALLQHSKKPTPHSEDVSIKFGEANIDPQDDINNSTSTRKTANKGEQVLVEFPSCVEEALLAFTKGDEVLLESPFCDAHNELKSSSQSCKDSDDGLFTWPGQQEDNDETTSIQSYTDEDGWLPWPEQQKNDSGDKDGGGGNILIGIMNHLKKEL